MPEKTTPIAKRAAQVAAFTVGGGVALAFALAGSASADTITSQDANVTNAGVGVANSGGNVAVGNTSDNSGGCIQGAVGVIANNSCDASNSSDGTAEITTGSATAVGNQSTTAVSQDVAAPDDGAGLVVTAQDADVTNAGVGVGNSGLNAAVGNDSDNTGGCLQGAVGFVANNSCDASNSSDGTASIHTGDATGIGNMSSTAIAQDATGGDGAGLAVVLQDADVTNVGIGLANSGGNLALGNISDNLGGCGQLALGFIANNTCDASNSSDGTASIVTGNATGIGNKSATGIHQGADVDPAGLAVVIQSAPVLNAGLGLANSGLNLAIGDDSFNQAIVAQVAFGLLANNVANAGSWTNGFAFVLTGSATGTGNDSTTWIDQTV
jgi:hypothetical protein